MSGYVNYQQRASEFKVGGLAVPFGFSEALAGRVVAVYPAIGMVDLEFPHGNGRFPVESLQIVTSIAANPPDPKHNSIPAAPKSVDAVEGAQTIDNTVPSDEETVIVRVASMPKKAIYWTAQDRHYKATAEELTLGYACPKCKDEILQPTIYKRQSGKSVKLLGCRKCLFLIKRCDIIGDPEYQDDNALKVAATNERKEALVEFKFPGWEPRAHPMLEEEGLDWNDVLRILANKIRQALNPKSIKVGPRGNMTLVFDADGGVEALDDRLERFLTKAAEADMATEVLVFGRSNRYPSPEISLLVAKRPKDAREGMMGF